MQNGNMLNFCCLELSVVEGSAFKRNNLKTVLLVIMLGVNSVKTWTAAAKINIHILPKTTIANCCSKISIVFNDAMGNVPWECRICTLNTILKL